ncbi:MAG: orotidine-5'-phosphate decarboxylase [Caulobacterales bacterium]
MDGSLAPSRTVQRDVPKEMADRLIVALDVTSPREAMGIVDRLDGIVSFFKIGMGLFVAEGTEAVISQLLKRGKSVFLDYKMYDIPETVSRGVAQALDRGIKFVTVHGDEEIMRAAVAAKGDSDFLKIFSITVLTSLDDNDLKEMGYALSVKNLIELRVRKALECGVDGIIASASDQPDEIRRLFDRPGLLIATPGIRAAGRGSDDHKRSATPAEAIRRGADFLVVGRPIIGEPDPAKAALEMIEDMKAGELRR